MVTEKEEYTKLCWEKFAIIRAQRKMLRTKVVKEVDWTNEIEWLEKEIKKHNQPHWEKQALVITDSEYTELVKELSTLDPTNPVLTKFHRPIPNPIG